MLNSTPTVADRKPEWREIASIQLSNTIYAAACSSVRASRRIAGILPGIEEALFVAPVSLAGLGAQSDEG